MSSQVRYAVGVDIGGTKTAFGLVDSKGRILRHDRFATAEVTDHRAFLARLSEGIAGLLASADLLPKAVAGVGIGSAGPLDMRRGIVRNGYTLPALEGRCITRPLQRTLGLPVLLENDADAALLGEAWVGAAKGLRSAVMLTFGTGVGGAALVDGRILRGANDEHPEIGHMPVRAGGPRCYCGRRGCLESIASGTAIAQAARLPTREVFAAAARGDVRCRRIIAQARDACVTAVWTVLHGYYPQCLVLGGGVMAEHFEFFAPALREVAAQAAMVQRPAVDIRKAKLGNRAGIIGAASLLLLATRQVDSKNRNQGH